MGEINLHGKDAFRSQEIETKPFSIFIIVCILRSYLALYTIYIELSKKFFFSRLTHLYLKHLQ